MKIIKCHEEIINNVFVLNASVGTSFLSLYTPVWPYSLCDQLITKTFDSYNKFSLKKGVKYLHSTHLLFSFIHKHIQ